MALRTLVAALAVAVVTLAIGAPALAKGPNSATVSGPGIGTTTIYWNRPDQHSLGELTQTTFLWDAAGAAGWETQPPPGDLGPKYTVVYHIIKLNNRLRGEDIRQDLYPFAAAGPVVYTAAGQHMYDTPTASGWHPASSLLTTVLRGLGADPKAAASRTAITPAAQTTARPADDDTGPAWPWIAAGATGVVVLFGVGALLRTRQRPGGRAA